MIGPFSVFPVTQKGEIAIFFLLSIVISIVAMIRYFPKHSLLFSVKCEMPMSYFLCIVKGLLFSGEM